MNTKETEVVARPDSRHYQALFCLRGRRFFNDGLHTINTRPAGHAAPCHGPKTGEQAFTGGLNPGSGAGLDFRQLHQALHAGLRGADVKMISYHVQEGFLTHKSARTVKGVAVSPRRVLLGDESHRPGKVAGGLRVTSLVPGPHHHADFANVRGEGLLDQDVQNGFLHAVLDEGLQRKRPLISSRRCDNRSSNPHV